MNSMKINNKRYYIGDDVAVTLNDGKVIYAMIIDVYGNYLELLNPSPYNLIHYDEIKDIKKQ